MKTSILVITLLINSVVPAALAASGNKATLNSSQEVFNSKWNYTPMIVRSEGESTVHSKMFRRQMWIENKPVEIASTNFVWLENPIKDKDPKKNELLYIAQSVKKSFGKEMKISGKENFYTIEGKFSKINRYIKVDLQRKEKTITIITTFARLGLYNKLENEISELHSVLETYDGKSNTNPKTTWYKWIPFIEEAHAQSLNLSNIFGGSNNTSGTLGSGFSYNLTGNFEDLTKGVSGLNNSVGKFNTSVDNTNVQLGIANGNWADTNKQADKFNTNVSEANKNWADTNKEAARANVTAEKFTEEAKMMNSNWAESNKTLAMAMDPNHMAKVAFYTAAGAALGGIAVNLAIQGVSEGISFLHELFTGAKKKKLEWEDFEKAMNIWDNQLNDLVKMEQVVDNYLAAFAFFEGKNLGNDYVKQLSIAMRDMRFDRDMFMEKFKDQNMNISCRKLYYDAADELDQKIKDYDKIIAFATNNSLSIQNPGANYFCNQLKELQRKILSAETQMQDLRLKILVAENQFYGKQSEAIDKRDESIEKVNERLENTLAQKKDHDLKVMDRIKDTHKQTKSDWLEACYEGKNEKGLAIKEELSNTFAIIAYFKKKNRCSEAFTSVEVDLKKRDEEAIRRIASEDELRKTLVVKANNNVEMKLSEEQMSWMSKLHMDAYCFQFAHGDAAKIPKKCSEFPEMLYSMNLSKGYEKAKNAYDSKCSERYLSGLKAIASQK